MTATAQTANGRGNGRTAVQRRTLPSRFEPQFWAAVDGRLAVVREIKNRVAALEADCGADSSQKRLLCERAVFLSCLLETREIEAVTAGTLDVGTYVQAVNGLTGLLKSLGLSKHARPVEDLRSYIARKTAERQDRDSEEADE